MTKKNDKNSSTTNVQPALLVKLMQQSEPCLFANKSEPAVIPVIKKIDPQISDNIKKIADKMMDVARWHAQLQVSFDQLLLNENI